MIQAQLPLRDHPVRILVVDDHIGTATTLARAIAQLGPGVEVIPATSGQEALEQVKHAAADILITDMIMPQMTGLELIEKLQNNPSGRPSFSFLITAYDVPGLKVTARRMNVAEVFTKPVNPERICQTVIRAMEKISQANPAPNGPVSQKVFTILVADDQPDNLTLMSRYLGNEGYKHIEARDGVETLEKVRNEMPDLVLLDVNMPQKDGFAVLEEIRADPVIQHIPVIILTAARLESMEVQFGLNLGADDYITKPFDRRELMARIRTKLRARETEDKLRRHKLELNLLPQIGKELSARLDLDELTTILLKRAVELLGAMFGHIVIFDSNKALHKSYWLVSPSPAPRKDYTLSNGLIEAVQKSREGFLIANTKNDPRWASTAEDPARSAVVIPMLGRHHLLGVLVLTNEQIDYFTLDHLLLLQAIASQASIAVENAQLYALLEGEQQRLSAVLQSAADAILMFDAETRLSLINPAAQKLFTDFEAKLGERLPSGAEYDSLLQLLDQAQHIGTSRSGEVVWPDQRVFSASVTSTREGGYVVVLHDVTHFKNLEHVKNEFIATISHDLRNPITSIQGFNHLIKMAGPLNEQQLNFIQRIQSTAENMCELVENMLALTKLDLSVEHKTETIDIVALLSEMVDEFQPGVEAKTQALTFEKTKDSLQVQGEAVKLRQLLRNLIGNAIKYTPAEGRITLSLEKRTDQVWIHVQDNGYGIPPADLPFIFDRFYRARNDNTKDIEGNGLGLAIVKSVVEQHGGQIKVKSEPEKGSCFSVILPLMQQEIPAMLNSEIKSWSHDYETKKEHYHVKQ